MFVCNVQSQVVILTHTSRTPSLFIRMSVARVRGQHPNPSYLQREGPGIGHGGGGSHQRDPRAGEPALFCDGGGHCGDGFASRRAGWGSYHGPGDLRVWQRRDAAVAPPSSPRTVQMYSNTYVTSGLYTETLHRMHAVSSNSRTFDVRTKSKGGRAGSV